jgi:hypothetical protein
MDRLLERSLEEAYMAETYLEGLFGGKPTRELVSGLGTVLDAVQEKDYALAGALAVRAYVRLRPTLDANLFVGSGALKDLVRALEAQGFQAGGTPGLIGDITTLTRGAFEVDFIVPRIRLAADALTTATDHPLGDRKVRVVGREHLAAVKFYVGLKLGGREADKHLQDARALVEAGADKARVRELLRAEDPALTFE